MSNTIFARPATFGDVEKTLAEIGKLEPNQYTVIDPGHPVYLEPVDIWIRPASDFTDPDSLRASIGSALAISRFVEFWHIETGKHTWLSDLPAGYVDERLAELPIAQQYNYFKPNAVTRIGDYLMVGLGEWYCVAERVLDGEPAFEFVSAREMLRRDEVEKQQYLPAALKHKPSWALKTVVTDVLDDSVEVVYESGEFVESERGCKESAILSLRALFSKDGEVLEMGRILPLLTAPEIYLEADDVTPRDVRNYAHALYRLAVVLEDALTPEPEAD